MIEIAATLIACIVLLRRWPALPMAVWLDRTLVAPIARRDATLTPGHWLLAGMIAGVVGAALWMGGDMIVVMAMGSPELLGLLATVEVAAYLDAALALVAAAGVARSVPLRHWFARIPRPRRRQARTMRKPANDDDEDPAGILSSRRRPGSPAERHAA